MKYFRLVPSVVALIACGFMLMDMQRWGFVFLFMVWLTIPLIEHVLDWWGRR